MMQSFVHVAGSLGGIENKARAIVSDRFQRLPAQPRHVICELDPYFLSLLALLPPHIRSSPFNSRAGTPILSFVT